VSFKQSLLEERDSNTGLAVECPISVDYLLTNGRLGVS